MGFTLPVALIQTGVGGAVATPAFIALSSSILGAGNNTMTLTKPTGTVSGDILVFYLWKANNFVITPPGSFVVEYDASTTFEGTQHTASCHYKLAGGAEPADYTWSFAGGANTKGGVLMTYRPASVTQLGNSTVEVPMNGGLTSDTHTIPSMNMPIGTMVYAWFFNRTGASVLGGIATPPAGMTQRYFSDFNSAGNSDHGMAIYDEARPVGGPPGTRTLITANSDIRSAGIGISVAA